MAAPIARSGGYDNSRFNASKHGILSRLVVLAHEDHAEFAGLLAALMEEHKPAGITERHLIEELAAVIWRKRRVLLAEGARIEPECIPTIEAHTLGEELQPHLLESLSRYETHLDRKFERTLGMLLRLKDLRGA